MINADAITADTGTVFSPRTHLTEIADNNREQTNLQGVVQWHPSGTTTLTADYTLFM